MVNLYVSEFDSTVQQGTVLEWDSSTAITMPESNAQATIYVKTSDILKIFMFSSDSTDVTNADTLSDINYYVNLGTPDDNPPYSNYNNCKLTNTNILSAVVTFGSISVSSTTLTAEESQIPQDFERYVVNSIFGNSNLLDIFNNETQVVNALYDLGTTATNDKNLLLKNVDIYNAMTTCPTAGQSGVDNNGWQFLTNSASTSTNICRKLLNQIQQQQPSRFSDLTDITSINLDDGRKLYQVPFENGDEINFLCTIKPGETQVSALNLSSPSQLTSHKYLIKFLLVSDDDVKLSSNVISGAYTTTPVADYDDLVQS